MTMKSNQLVGKIIIHGINKNEEDVKVILELEQYLNESIALAIFKKFKLLFRVHF